MSIPRPATSVIRVDEWGLIASQSVRGEDADRARELRWLREENDRLRENLDAVLNSTSWRITAPVRRLVGLRQRNEVQGLVQRNRSAVGAGEGARLHAGSLPDGWLGRGAGDTTVCAVVHVFYPELLPEIVERLLLCRRLTDVIITHPLHISESDLVGSLTSLRAMGVRVRCVRVENLGRDVWPLVQVIDHLLATSCHAFVKVHTKRTPHVPAEYGDRWRTELLEGLLPGPDGIEEIVTFLANAPVPGYVAPARWIARTAHRERTRRHLRQLCERGGIRCPYPVWFPAGTMYWCGRNWLEFLRALELGRNDFEPEPLPPDGTMAHAVERLIGCFSSDRRADVWQTRFGPER